MDDDDFAELFKKPTPPSSGTSWQDVAAEFEALGKTLGDALRGAWQRQDTDEAALGGLRDSLQSMIQELNRAVDGTPEAQQARDQLVHLTESIRAAAERTSEELRPELVTLLRQANAELRRLTLLDE
jgi:hypothetical protein